MKPLYPLTFKPQPKSRIWGGHKLRTLFDKPFSAAEKIGESWELSAVQRNLSIVANGFLKGNTIEELIEVYLGELVGDRIYERYGVEFPILVKLIDAAETLSVQVHPDDATALERHNAYGKTEMWYVLQADKGAGLYVGFNRHLSPAELYERVQRNTLTDALNFVAVQPGDMFFIAPGTIHAIGQGIVLAEIQQTSDITYRVYDWGREHNPATARDMHLDLAIDVIDYSKKTTAKTPYHLRPNTPVPLARSSCFITDLLELDRPMARNLADNDSFIIYVCLDGCATLRYASGNHILPKGQTILVPAAIADINIIPEPAVRLLETYL
ncbi:MAG: class I mannose-6-phosphate isomerase [Prevotellaceae bacterium]|jgi:mannose-6-phosphate isomerase|nr:class I mannose-6-phosphate isomerase [Prevotellaceae bacterium]